MGKRKVIFLLVLLFTIGFASITGTLILTNTLNLAFNDDFKVIFTDALLDNHRNLSLISGDKQSITFETKKMISTVEVSMFEYEATNTSRNYDAEVVISCKLNGTDEIITKGYLSIEYDPKNMIVGAGESKRGNITIKLTKQVLEDEDLDLKCMLEATPVERESLGEEYVNPNDQSRVLMTPEFIDTYDTRGAFWNYKEYITKVTFETEMIPHETFDCNRHNFKKEALIFDVSTLQNGSVMAYLVEENEELMPSLHLYIQGDGGVIANSYSTALFSGMDRLEKIEGLEYFDTSSVVDMSRMFAGCISLVELDLTTFDTSNVVDMQGMFYLINKFSDINYNDHYSKLVEIKGLENFNTSNVTNMKYMFSECDSIESLNISTFDTTNVTDMQFMFLNCKKLTKLDLSNFNTVNVVDMQGMFGNCLSLENLILTAFDTLEVTNMSYMFKNCASLTTLDISNFKTNNVTDMQFMFSYCEKLTYLNLSDFNNVNVVDMQGMFLYCSSLVDLILTNFKTSKVTNMSEMFAGCLDIIELDLSSFDTSSVIDMSSMFYRCWGLNELDLSNFDTSSVTDMSSMFYMKSNRRAGGLILIKGLENFDTLNVVDMHDMFAGCMNITELNLSSFDTSRVTDMSSMFSDCYSLNSLNISSFDFRSDLNVKNMFDSMALNYGGDALIIVKNANIRTLILAMDSSSRPSSWTEENVIVKA